jgi:centromere protein C
LTNRSVNAGVTNKNAARQNGKARLVATEAVDFSDGDGEGDENVDSFAAGRDDFSDGYDEGDETVMPEEPADTTVQDLNGQEDEVSPAPAASRQTKTTASSSKQPKKGPTAKTTKVTKPAAKPTGKRGRAPKSQQAADNEEPAEVRPAKKPKTAAATSQAPREPLDPELERVVENYAQRTGPLKGRSLYILKREDPTSSETTHTRSGRVSVRPLAYWRNERCVYGDEEAAEGERFPLSKIKEVIRTEELEPEKPKKGKRSRKGKKKQKDESSDEDEIDDDADLWEKETGVLHGYVSKWDPVAQTSTAEEEVIGMISMSRLVLDLFRCLHIPADIAYAPSGFETREVKGASFKFAKLLSSSFIGSGVVELPPDGVKKPKNSKRMHMVFYVCYGRVQVDICGVQFSAGKGSVFQIPRGEFTQRSHQLLSIY